MMHRASKARATQEWLCFCVQLFSQPRGYTRFRPGMSGDLTKGAGDGSHDKHQLPCFLLCIVVPHTTVWRCVKKDQMEDSYSTVGSWGCMLCGAGAKMRLKDNRMLFYYVFKQNFNNRNIFLHLCITSLNLDIWIVDVYLKTQNNGVCPLASWAGPPINPTVHLSSIIAAPHCCLGEDLLMVNMGAGKHGGFCIVK